MLLDLNRLAMDNEARKVINKYSMIDTTLLYYASDIIHELDNACDSKTTAKNIWRWIFLDTHNQKEMTCEEFSRLYRTQADAKSRSAAWEAYKRIMDKLLAEIQSREKAYRND